jgi:4-alpha-glucanotransferase
LTDARGWGVQPEYCDAAGRTIRADPAVVAGVVAELSGGGGGPPPAGALIVHPGDVVDRRRFEVVTEDGRTVVVDGRVPDDLPLGYHRVTDAAMPERVLVCSPGRCFLPAGLRLGGWAVQLYALRSRASWGIGDLADLGTFGRWAAAQGNGFALINPLSAVAPSVPVEDSPYRPTSRRFGNPLYLRVEETPGAARVGAELAALGDAARALNADRLIDRDAVNALKLEALALVEAASPPPADFRRWRRARGDPLRRFAIFCALAEEHGGDWETWPQEFRDPASPATRRAARRLSARVRFFAWLQWALELQVDSAASALPLMQDLPIGVDPGGADVWADQHLYAGGFSVGAPPDLFNVAGQDWSQSPFHPWRLRAAGYAPLVAIFRAAFRSSAALRIDHVMGLFRLYWIPRGSPAGQGVFVRYPADDILDILALESVRAGAYVVGEDLGTVEPEVREQMAARDILSYRLLWFEDASPSALPERAMSAATTHDLPTVVGLWSGRDLDAQRAIGLTPNVDGTAEIRLRLGRVVGDAGDAPPAEVIVAAYTALARSPSMLVAAALEDAAEVAERPNMPGITGDRWPNWRRALPLPLEEVLASPLAERLAGILRRE